MSARRFIVCAILVLLCVNGANAARYQRTKDGKTIVWNSLRGVAQEVTWSGLRDLNGYAQGEGTLTWYRLNEVVNSYTGKMAHGKFEGPVIREQGGTRVQATFANGEKVSNWVEPSSTTNNTPTPTATPKPKPIETPEPQPTEEAPVESLLPTPLPSLSQTAAPARTPTPRATATATPTPSPSPTPRPTPLSPAATRTPFPTPSPTFTSTSTPTLTLTPPILRSFLPSPSPQESPDKKSQLEEMVEIAPRDSRQLAISPSPPREKLEQIPSREPLPTPTALARVSPAKSTSPRTSATPNPKDLDAKRRLIAEFKQQTDSVVAEVARATGNFREIDDFTKVQALPKPVSAKVTLLANQASVFRAKVGYETAVYECLAQIETVEALIIVDQFTGDLAAKDAPAARRKLANFLQRYSHPSDDGEKPLWNYLHAALEVGNRARDAAEPRLKQARALEAAGKKSEALREYQEIYRIYPNHITADAIKTLENEH